MSVDPMPRFGGKHAFLDGASYFGEWYLQPESQRWIPHGRGIAVNFNKQMVYFG